MSEHEKAYWTLKCEVENIVKNCVKELNLNDEKIKFDKYFTKNETLYLRYSRYALCLIKIDPVSNNVKKIIIIDDSVKNKSGRGKPIEYSINELADIENYKDMMVAHLEHYLGKK